MARYEHLPIFKASFDLAVHLEKIVRHFGRYHKYSLGNDLRQKSRGIMETVMKANQASDRLPLLLELRSELEAITLLARLCHESGGFKSTKAYLYVAQKITEIAKQNEGWLNYSKRVSSNEKGR